MLETIKCLSLQQPYADEVFSWGKFVENRSWPTDYRGELWIHASKISPGFDSEELKLEIDKSPTGLLTGLILGRVNLVACVSSDVLFSVATDAVCQVLRRKPKHRPAFDESNPDAVFLKKLLANVDPITWQHFCFDPFAWIFTKPDMLDQPIPAKGKLRIWELEVPTDQLVLANDNRESWK